jgi:hypothetical protein
MECEMKKEEWSADPLKFQGIRREAFQKIKT